MSLAWATGHKRQPGFLPSFRSRAVTRSCGQTLSMNNSYFVDPGSASGAVPVDSGERHCAVSITNLPSTVCQLRLELDRFDLIGPDENTGLCTRDSFSVSGQDSNSAFPPICGINHRQHSESMDAFLGVSLNGNSLSIIFTQRDELISAVSLRTQHNTNRVLSGAIVTMLRLTKYIRVHTGTQVRPGCSTTHRIHVFTRTVHAYHRRAVTYPGTPKLK